MFFPVDVSAAGHWIDGLFFLAFGMVAITFVLVIGILGLFLFRFRAQEGRKGAYIKGETTKARVFTIIFAIFIFIVIDMNLAFHDHIAWEHAIGGPIQGTPLKIEILAQQFAWNIRYTGPDGEFNTQDDIVTINQMHVPNNQPVLLQMKSKDVIHSFFLPNFRIKQDVVPGMVTMMKFKPVKLGQYDIACAEHCGLGHYRMRGTISIDETEDFENWLTERAKEPSPDPSWGWTWRR